MSLPEIPPKLDWLFWKHGETGYQWVTLGGDNYCLVDGHERAPNTTQRIIIACVAAEYWRMEHERILSAAIIANSSVMLIDDKCLKHAEAWRTWGGLIN